MCVKSLQLCPTLCNPMDWSPPGSPAHGILQARILEWVARPSSRGSSRPRGRAQVSSSCSGGRAPPGKPFLLWLGSVSCVEQKWKEWSHCLVSSLKKWKLLSRVQLFVAPWTTQSTDYSRPEFWSGEPFPSPGDLANPGIEPSSLTLQADSLPQRSIWLFIKRGVSCRDAIYQIEKVLSYSLFADNFYHELLNFVKEFFLHVLRSLWGFSV